MPAWPRPSFSPSWRGARTLGVARDAAVRLFADRLNLEPEKYPPPFGLVDIDDIWHLIAATEKGTFRVERIKEATVTEVSAERPADFDRSDAWGQVIEEMERRPSLLAATLLIEERYLWR